MDRCFGRRFGSPDFPFAFETTPNHQSSISWDILTCIFNFSCQCFIFQEHGAYGVHVWNLGQKHRNAEPWKTDPGWLNYWKTCNGKWMKIYQVTRKNETFSRCIVTVSFLFSLMYFHVILYSELYLSAFLRCHSFLKSFIFQDVCCYCCTWNACRCGDHGVSDPRATLVFEPGWCAEILSISICTFDWLSYTLKLTASLHLKKWMVGWKTIRHPFWEKGLFSAAKC